MDIFTSSDDEQWAPISDLMAVLMLIFMLIALLYVNSVFNTAAAQGAEQNVARPVSAGTAEAAQEQNYLEQCEQIYYELQKHFGSDFRKWGVDLLKPDATVRFRHPKVLFASDSYEIRPYFGAILSSFYPRYVRILRKFSTDIRKIRIEGHTSSEYGNLDEDKAFFENLKLSHARTYAVMFYVLNLSEANDNVRWAKKRMTANGLSSTNLIVKDGKENKQQSRRVEFRLIAESCEKAGVYGDI